MNIPINSQWNIGAELPEAETKEIKTEPMLFRCDSEHAFQLGGRLTRLFMGALPEEWKTSNLIIDSRVHMLMPGMYPCIPGWHHDDVPREREDGQPNYETPSYKAEHIMAIWGDCSRTEFALGQHLMNLAPLGQKIYKVASPEIEKLCLMGKLQRQIAPERTMIGFDWQTWHRGAQTTHPGFRFFIRATRKSLLAPKNEQRFNANVYMPVIEEGW